MSDVSLESESKAAAECSNGVAWARLVGLVGMHVGCLGVIWVGWSATAVVVAVLLYILRAFALTAFYHRYFSHRAFKTSRWFQFVGGLLGTTAMQKGPLWWAAHHRLHHREADQEGDVHSPNAHSFLWSHVGWIVSKQHSDVREKLIGDWLKFPELRWLDRHSLIVGLAYAVVLYVAGELLAAYLPTLDTSGSMLVVWGFFISTVALYHATYAVNSFSHLFGTRRFETRDNSRNNLVVAILTLGEGWHNNHHRYQSSTRQGFVWWELDVTYYALLVLSKLRLVWELRPVPQHVMDTAVDRRDNLRR